MQDPISDMLTRLRNGSMAMLKEVSMPSSKMKEAIAKVLKEEGFIADYTVEGDVKKTLTIELKYFKRQSVIEDLERVSKPSDGYYKQLRALASEVLVLYMDADKLSPINAFFAVGLKPKIITTKIIPSTLKRPFYFYLS